MNPNNYSNQMKSSYLLNKRLKKKKNDSKLEITESDLHANILRVSKTLHHSKNSYRIDDSDSNSEKRSLSNIGSHSDTNSSNDKFEIKKSKSDSYVRQSGQSDEMFKTISGGIELDNYLHVYYIIFYKLFY